jgi:hypothetical protein
VQVTKSRPILTLPASFTDSIIKGLAGCQNVIGRLPGKRVFNSIADGTVNAELAGYETSVLLSKKGREMAKTVATRGVRFLSSAP